MRKQRHVAYANCPVEAALDIIGGKWKSIILFRLLEQTRRFSELRRLLPAITPRTLTTQLRELEDDGLVHRTVHAEVPPRVEYRLTELGQSLLPVLQALKSWSEAHMPAWAEGRRQAAAGLAAGRPVARAGVVVHRSRDARTSVTPTT